MCIDVGKHSGTLNNYAIIELHQNNIYHEQFHIVVSSCLPLFVITKKKTALSSNIQTVPGPLLTFPRWRGSEHLHSLQQWPRSHTGQERQTGNCYRQVRYMFIISSFQYRTY